MTIEKALLDIGKSVYQEVILTLNKKYHCYLTDCYEKPEYLHEILKGIFGNASNVVVESIKEDLEQYKGDKQIARFLEVINKYISSEL